MVDQKQAVSPDPRFQIGKYDVRTLLGKGATGTVYLAIDTFSGREVALKTIGPEVFSDPEFGTLYRSQFLNEASLAGKLKHPHIVSILDAAVHEDSGYIAMECVEGGALSQYASEDRLLPVADVIQIGFKCCGALEYAFREGIVHRDIKPANILIVHGTDVKISDFGAAFLRKTQAMQTTALGSPFYMSPEQIEGGTLTHHSDMYSLGVVLYELLTGKRPFIADNIEALVKKIQQENPAPPSSLRAGLPQAIDRVVLRAMGKKPEHRYPSWTEFAVALSNVGQLVLPPDAIADSAKFLSLKGVETLDALSDAELWELAGVARWSRVAAKQVIVREDEPGQSFFFLAKGEAKVIRQTRLLNVVARNEFFGEMAWIRGGEIPRHATVESMTELLLAEFEPAALMRMSLGAQLQLTRALVRNLVERLVLANTRLQKN
jgi:serine/threonine protein kinase